jgi:hypothetical protein
MHGCVYWSSVTACVFQPKQANLIRTEQGDVDASEASRRAMSFLRSSAVVNTSIVESKEDKAKVNEMSVDECMYISVIPHMPTYILGKHGHMHEYPKK